MKDETGKIPFDIDVVMKNIRTAVKPFKKAAMFELHDDGFTSAFEQLIACIMSIRTYDEVSIEAARRLFKIARTPEEVLKLSVEEIDAAITPSTFHEAKAYQIKEIAERVLKEFGGELPCDFDVLTSFKGVGPKCANLALGIACGQKRISVDIHVHRVTNRWGYVATSTPEKTMVALEKVLPKKYWIEINRLLVPFGKNICTGNLPKCSVCPVLKICRQIGVEKHR
jgi:endonuclease-3